MDEWVDGWVDGGAGLRNAYSNTQTGICSFFVSKKSGAGWMGEWIDRRMVKPV